MPAAGLPWFMTLFGRDSLITSYQALPFVPELARRPCACSRAAGDARRRLPRRGAGQDPPRAPPRRDDGVRGAPALALLRDGGRDAAVPDPARRVRALDRRRRAGARPRGRGAGALDWIDEYGDRDGDGYVEYERRNTETGLENQCWKDSWNSILFADGTLAACRARSARSRATSTTPRSACARLAREFWGDDALADRLEREAAELKRRFNGDFWLADREFFALALDGEKRQVDSLTSNIGHLLWSGIVDDDKAAAACAAPAGRPALLRLGRADDGGRRGRLQPDRLPRRHRLAARQLAHRRGPRRYGYREEAARLAPRILEAADVLRRPAAGGLRRLPAGGDALPGRVPDRLQPAGLGTGAPLLLLRALLGLEPEGDELRVEPAPAALIGKLTAFGSPAVGGQAEVEGTSKAAPSSPDVAELNEFFDSRPGHDLVERAKRSRTARSASTLTA